MITFELSRNAENICVWGDYFELDRLNTFVHHVIEESAYITDKEGFVMALAYDARKAYERQRLMRSYSDPYDDARSQSIYGVEISLPLLIVQIAVLRYAMAFMPTSKLDQSIMYELEFNLESLLKKEIPKKAEAIITFMGNISSLAFDELNDQIDQKCDLFAHYPKRDKLSKLLSLLQSFYEQSFLENTDKLSDNVIDLLPNK